MADNEIKFPTPEETKSINDIVSALDDNSAVGMEEFAALLSMEDEQFDIFSEMILVELNKSLNNPTDRILLQKSLEENNIRIEDLPDMLEQFSVSIENVFGDQLSQKKKDFLVRVATTITNGFMDVEGLAKKIINIPIEVEDGAQTPTYAHDGDAAMDIYALGDYDINPGETVKIRTGIKVAIPLGYGLLVQPRSGMSGKTKLRIPNTPGLIDSGYRDEICVLMENIDAPIKELGECRDTEYAKSIVDGALYGESYHIDNGQRIAQMRLVETPAINWIPVNDIKAIEGDRGGGFGSSGE